MRALDLARRGPSPECACELGGVCATLGECAVGEEAASGATVRAGFEAALGGSVCAASPSGVPIESVQPDWAAATSLGSGKSFTAMAFISSTVTLDCICGGDTRRRVQWHVCAWRCSTARPTLAGGES